MTTFCILNWKSYPASADDIRPLCGVLASWREVVSSGTIIICPPTTLIDDTQACKKEDARLASVVVGAQYLDADAKTGGLTPAMLRASGATAALIGHSDRRTQSGETNADVRAAWQQAVAHDILPIVCVGQHAPDASFAELREQVCGAFEGASATDIAQCVIAYEPVWAISTTPGARVEEPQDIVRAIQVIRETLQGAQPHAVLYGGSVTGATVGSVLGSGVVDGVLVGRASASPESLKELLDALTPFFS